MLGAAGRGNMGQVIAQRFADEGAKVIVAGRREEELSRFAKEISGDYALCDITVRVDLDRLVEKATDAYGGVDIALNATGWGFVKRFDKTTEHELDKILALQFKGPVLFLSGDGARNAKTRRRIDHSDLVSNRNSDAQPSCGLHGHKSWNRSCDPLRRLRIRKIRLCARIRFRRDLPKRQ